MKNKLTETIEPEPKPKGAPDVLANDYNSSFKPSPKVSISNPTLNLNNSYFYLAKSQFLIISKR